MNVAPPANGKKLWRVKRTFSAPACSQSQSSLECLNNSLKIANAARFKVKRPPSRRPKNKPGQAKDFVFVDLSPVTAESPIEPSAESSPKEDIFDVYDDNVLNNSFFDTSFGNYVAEVPSPASTVESDCLGLGIMGVDMSASWSEQNQQKPHIEQPQIPQVNDSFSLDAASLNKQLYDYQKAMIEQQQQIQLLQQQLKQKESQNLPKVRKPKKRKSSGQFQFKTYTGPKKPKVETTASAPVSPKASDLEDFFMLNDQLMPFNESLDNTDLGAGIDQFLMRPEELYTGFV